MLSHAIRFLTIEAIEKAKSGHAGMPLSLADVVTVLFQKHLRFYAPQPKWKHRDKFIISNGHGSMLLYSLMYLTGYPDITLEDIKNFRQYKSLCAGHPEYGLLKGIEATTGHLGQGLGNAIGMALADQKYGVEGRYIFVTVSDGDLMEGVSHEVLALAGQMQLSKLIILYDDNGTTIDDYTTIDRYIHTRLQYYGFDTHTVDGYDHEAIDQVLTYAKQGTRPQFISCKTITGYGVPGKEGTPEMHAGAIGRENIELMKEHLKWPYEPFEIPDFILQEWRSMGCRFEKEFEAQCELDDDFQSIRPSKTIVFNKLVMSTREAFGQVIEHYDVMGGSADLGHSTQADHVKNYIAFGVRELGMASILNGIVLTKLYRVFGATFFIFSDYMKPAIRLAAIMKIPVVYIFSHDSIGVGEDGTTHQPCEHLVEFRAMPNLNVYRPCDAYETQECIKQAFEEVNKPSIIVLSRQDLPVLPTLTNGVIFEKGDMQNIDIVFVATGSEVHLALEIAKEVEGSVRVLSIPCLEKFQDDLLLEGKKRVIIEAASRMSWEKLLRKGDLFFGVDDFGMSAPYKDIYRYFGLAKENILEKIKNLF